MILQLLRGLIGGGLCLLVSLSALGAQPINGVLMNQDQLGKVDFKLVRAFGYSSVVVSAQKDGAGEADLKESLGEIKQAGLGTSLWIEVGRDPELAAAHPEWMASIQGHPEWRRFFPDFPKLKQDQVVKVFPWVPISYEEAFVAQLKKVERMLTKWPSMKTVFLNDIQAAPSACGCGHPLCRWTADYGPIKTATPLKANFAARFVRSVKALRDGLEVIPVWATECEEGDKPGLCAGVGCFNGACWRDWSAQLEPVAAMTPRIGALLLRETFQRSDTTKDSKSAWLSQIPSMFKTMPEKYQRPGIGPERLIAVIEGWTSMKANVPEQLMQLRAAGVQSFIVAETKINQAWEPRVHSLP